MSSAPFDTVDAITRFDDALSRGDETAAVSLVGHMMEDGADLVTVLSDVIGAAQREVGRRWQRGLWSVAQEHVATAVTCRSAYGLTSAIQGSR